MNGKQKTKVIIWMIIIIFIYSLFAIGSELSKDDNFVESFNRFSDRKNFRLLSNEDNSSFDDELIAYAKKNGIKLTIDHADDLEAIDIIESNPKEYDALWLSNSTWIRKSFPLVKALIISP